MEKVRPVRPRRAADVPLREPIKRLVVVENLELIDMTRWITAGYHVLPINTRKLYEGEQEDG